MATTDILSTPGGVVRGRGYAGQGDMNPAVSVSRINETADVAGVGVDFGVAVAYGVTAGNEHCKKWTSDTDKFLGFTERYIMRPLDPVSGQTSYHQNETVSIRRMGRLLVTAVEATTAGDNVIILTASGGALGSITGGAAAPGRVSVTGAKWAETVSAGQLGWIEFNLLGQY